MLERLLTRLAALATLLALPLAAAAHDVPDEVTVLAYVKPEGQTLTLLLRAPLKALRDVDIPLDEEGFLDLGQVDTALEHASQLWIRDFVKVFENGERLPPPRLVAARVSLPSDRLFTDSYEAAYAHTTEGELPAGTRIRWEDGLLAIAYEYPIASEQSQFSIEPGLTRLGIQVNVMMRYLAPDGEVWPYDVHAYVGRVDLDPGLLQATALFAERGFLSTLRARDHLLLLLALALPFVGVRPLLLISAAVFVGQAVGLISSFRGIQPDTLWFPYLVPTLVAAGALYLALDSIVGARVERRWRVAIFLGMLFGFDLAAPMAEMMQFAGSHVASSVLAFTVGAGLAVLVVLAAVMVGLHLLFRHVVEARLGTIILAAFIAHSAWHMTMERWELLSRFPLPTLNSLVASDALAWASALTALAAVLWLSSGIGAERSAPGGATGRKA